ncbi:synaptonemal complex central element protein 1-like [Leptodactylus fuscus]
MDPKMEDVIKKISTAQKDKEQIEIEQQELEKEIKAAQSELHKLNAEKRSKKEILMKKQETIEILKLRRENQLKKEKNNLIAWFWCRQQEQIEEAKIRIEDLTNKIKEEKLMQRQQRMEFQEQMEDLMKKHKALGEFYDAKRIGVEIEQMKERKMELLQEEKEKLAKLQELEETEVRLRKEGVLTSENLFLRSEEATRTLKLFEDENTRAKDMLEKARVRHREVLEKYNRLKSQLEEAERNLSKVSQAASEEPQAETSRVASMPSSILFPNILVPKFK